MYLTNKDMNLLCDIEILLHEKLVQTNGIKEVFEGKESYYFDENDKDYELWVKYWNLIENLIQRKQIKNKINSQRIREKRKINKNYARSKKELMRKNK